MGFTYAIADLHGRYDLLLMAYEAIRGHQSKTAKTIVYLGDYVDRGPESRQIIEWLMRQRVIAIDAGLDRIVLKGNHEDIMVRCCRLTANIGWWLKNGGGHTLISYGQKNGDKADPSFVPSSHLDWLANLPFIYFDKHRVFVHALVDPSKPLDQQDENTCLWELYPDGAWRGHGKRHVVHGHHQFADGPKSHGGRTNLDTFAWATGRLVVGVFDDDQPGGPVDFLEVIGKPYDQLPS